MSQRLDLWDTNPASTASTAVPEGMPPNKRPGPADDEPSKTKKRRKVGEP
jgi:hypothetical protein